jgi:hypothetical protein
MSYLKFVIFAVWLAVTASVMAQPNPTVEIVLSQPTAQMGQTIIAEVYVRNAVNIAGADVGITVDEECLRITDRQTGEFLPTESEQGGFSAFSELNEHDTRLAASLIQRSHIANGDAVFFRATMEVTCERSTAPLNVSFVELTGIEDLEAENATFLVYTLDEGNVDTINAQLAIGPAGQVTPIATVTSEAPAVDTSATPVPAPVEAAPQTQPLLIVAVTLMVIAVGGLLLLLLVARRRSRNR